MKKMFTLITAAVLLTANLNIGMIATAEDTECDHHWVEQTSTIHHDAEYATKTIWAHILWVTFDGENMMPDAPNEYDFGSSEGIFSYNRGDRVFNAEDLIDEFDLVSFGLDGIDYLDFPDETFRKRITINNYEEYGMTYEEFCNQTDEYNLFNHKNPEFNPELDELVDFSLDARAAGDTKYEEMYYDDLWNPTSVITGSMNISYADDTDPYWPIRQYQILVADAYDEEVTQYVCEECGTVGTKNDDGTITVDLPAETTEPPAETTTTTVTTTTAAESTTTTTTAETTTPTETTTTTPSAYVVMSGDYNGDKEKSVADAILLARFVAEDSDLSAEQLQKMISAEPDYNGDGLVTLLDIAALLNDLK